jgi:hypothetical protein
MVIAPLLVVKVNWACTTAGSDKSSNSGNNLATQAVLKHQATVFGQAVFGIELIVSISFLAKVCLGYMFYLTQWL